MSKSHDTYAIHQLTNRLDRMERTLDELKASIDELKTICSRMDTHISFVEHTYSTLKSPIEYIKSYFPTSEKKKIEIHLSDCDY